MRLRYIYIIAGVVVGVAVVLAVAFCVENSDTKPAIESIYLPAEEESTAMSSVSDGRISRYDKIFRKEGRRHKIDWRLLAAMAYAESHFNPDAVSSRGAVGLMQVMPHIAEAFDVPREQLTDVEVNIEVGARIYRSMMRMLQLPKDIDNYDRMAMTVASYNCGASRVIDARNLAEYYDDNPNDWSTVSDYLLLLADEEFYDHEAVQGGRFARPKMTIAYVESVMTQYDKYCQRVEE